MKNYLLALLVAMQACVPAFGATGAKTDATYAPGLRVTKNFIKNPDCQNLFNVTNSAGIGLTSNTSTPLITAAGSQCRWNPGGTGTLKFDIDTLSPAVAAGNCEASFYTGATTAGQYIAYLEYDSVKVTSNLAVNATVSGQKFSIAYPCSSTATTRKLVIEATTSPSLILVGGVSFGENLNIGSTSQATLVGTVKVTGCANTWTTTSTTYANLSTQTTCVYTTTGALTAPATMIAGFSVPNLGPGEYVIEYEGALQVVAQVAGFRFSDGTNVTREESTTLGTLYQPFAIKHSISYSTAQSNVTFQLQGKTASGTIEVNGTTAHPGVFRLFRYPTTSELVTRANLPVLPTIQTFTSGSGTYTTPSGVSYIRVRMVGGGGGGAGSGTTAGTAATDGGTTSFGTSLLVANGGVHGLVANYGGDGGTASLGTGPKGVALAGTKGYGGSTTGGTNSALPEWAGASGGPSAFGGAGGGTYSSPGLAAGTNTGSGGAGGGCGATFQCSSGSGGGSGGYVDAIITSPLSSYSYAIGAAGSAGAAGTSGFAGGAGAAGIIIVEEYYQNANTPVFIGSVSSNTSGTERIERLIFGGSGSTGCTTDPCTIKSQSGSWVSIVNRSAAGAYTVAVPSGMFPAMPTCICQGDNITTSPASCMVNPFTSTATSLVVTNKTDAGGAIDDAISIICMGPR